MCVSEIFATITLTNAGVSCRLSENGRKFFQLFDVTDTNKYTDIEMVDLCYLFYFIFLFNSLGGK